MTTEELDQLAKKARAAWIGPRELAYPWEQIGVVAKDRWRAAVRAVLEDVTR